MEKLKKLYPDEVEEIARGYRIDVEIIKEIIEIWEDYYYNLHDSFEEFKKLPVPKYGDMWSKIEPEDLAKLSQFYHTNQKEIEQRHPSIFKKVKFTSLSPNKKDDLKLSAFATNQIIKVYFEKMAKEYLLLEQQGYAADKVLNFNERLGKRTNDKISMRDMMIKLAASYLKSKKIKSYTPIIKDLLFKIGFDKVEPGTIRQIVKRS